MLRVRCQAHATLDAKGRLALPAALRRALSEADQPSLVLTFFKGSLWGFTSAEFEETIERPLSQRDPFADDVRAFTDALIAPSQEVEIDNAGRIRIPAPLRELAGLDKEVVINSVLNRVEIWDKDAWERRFAESLAATASASGMPKGTP